MSIPGQGLAAGVAIPDMLFDDAPIFAATQPAFKGIVRLHPPFLRIPFTRPWNSG